MFCENCGQKIEDNGSFCVSCGTRVDGQDINQNQNQPTPAQTTPQQVISPNIQQQNSQIINNNIIIGGKIKKNKPNYLWTITIGWLLAMYAYIFGLVLMITVIGAPIGKKLMSKAGYLWDLSD